MSREWVKYLPEVIDYLNNYPTRLIRAPGSSKWGLAPAKAIKLGRVDSRPSTKYKRPVGKNEENKLKKGDTVRYLLANAEWEGGMENQKRATDPTFSPSIHKIRKIVVTKNEPVLYYLGDDDEYAPKCGFVREELLYVNIDTLQYPPQSILEENTHSRSINFVRIINKMSKAVAYAERRGRECLVPMLYIKLLQSNDDAKHRISDSPLGLHPLYLPEILTEIFSYLAEDKTLYPTLFVNRLWYLCSTPILWKRVEFVGCKKSLIYWKKFKKVVHTRKPLYISKLNELYISRCKVSGGTLYQIR
ncbi:7276_t:CDS:2, partial [Entrophospora sp. SA101]